ncbi:hypothetical protein NA56DRAFT_652634 [Hyaloscypha hepaticicola]|uniref:BTB domain-containing protein n=1 Tax=Hyaloscypha hepaticicola TaxID=2082293 RepID=A0A2J6PE11_9HELO|nr:hypothetical protein NA56DRAFT_652634 [Hyaloscypha hepaticicola]
MAVSVLGRDIIQAHSYVHASISSNTSKIVYESNSQGEFVPQHGKCFDANERLNSPLQSRLTPHASNTTIVLDINKSIKFNTDMLKHTSTYFASMHRYPDAWPEARAGVVKLNGVDLATLEVYKYWLQTGQIEDTDTLIPECCLPLRSDRMLSQEPNKLRPILVGNRDKIYITPVKVDRLDQLVQCWIFADYIGAPAFQNDLMDAILSLYAETHYEDYAFPLYNIPFICKNAPSGVCLRAFIVNSIYSCLSGKTLKKASSFKLIPKDLALAVAVLAMGGAHDVLYNCGLPPWQRSFCTWHVHPDGELNAPCEDPYTWNGRSKEELPWDYHVDKMGAEW